MQNQTSSLMPGRPVPGALRQIRGGPVVRVKAAGMRWAHVIDPNTGTNERVVRLQDLLTVTSDAQTLRATKPRVAQGERPSMDELNKEFLG